MRLLLRMLLLLSAAASGAVAAAQDASLTGNPDSVKFAVIGDTGTGSAPQFAVGRQMADARVPFPFDFVIMLGDNMYGSQDSRAFRREVRAPVRPAAAGRREVLRLARQPRQSDQSLLQIVQYGRGAVLHLLERERALLRDRYESSRSGTAGVD